jgi:TrmH family RNA methyltransferase
LKQISSAQNPFIKKLVQLQEKAKVRKETNTFLIEGKREFMLAVKGNYSVETVLFVSNLTSKEDLDFYIQNTKDCIEITQEIYQKLAYRDSTEGVIAIVNAKSHKIFDLKLPENPLILVVESIEKPGNLGAMLRTADAANVDAVLIANPKSDLYNPNLIRSSVGCVFTNSLATGSSEEIIEYLKNKNIAIYAATLQNSNGYHLQNYSQGSAIVVGTEATGLTQIWRDNANQNIVIPMQGQIDSMNVSVAAAILLFEAKRQRGF